MNFEEIAIIHQPLDDVAGIVRTVGVVWDDVDEVGSLPLGVVSGVGGGRIFHVVRRQEREQAPHFL